MVRPTLALLAAALPCAAAFAPSSSSRVETSLASDSGLDFTKELGVQAPLGFFDPLGLLNGADEARFNRLRAVELKHGRVSMLAFLGQITTRAGYHWDGNIDYAGHRFDSYPDGWAAISGPNAIPGAGLAQIVFLFGTLEWIMQDVTNSAEFVGDFRNGKDFGWSRFSEEKKLSKRRIELNNGRAAMCGILGLMVHEQIGNLDSLLPGGGN